MYETRTAVDRCVANPYIYTGDPRPPIPPRVMASSAMGLKLGVFGFLPTTHAKTHAKQMRPWSLHAVRHFTRVYLHTRTVVDAGDICTWWTTFILITGKTWRPLIWAPCRIQDGAGSGISRVYLWANPTCQQGQGEISFFPDSGPFSPLLSGNFRNPKFGKVYHTRLVETNQKTNNAQFNQP